MTDIISKSTTNRYDNLIIIYITLQIFGVIGDAIQPIRIFIILFIPFVLLFFTNNKEISSHYKYERFFFVFWIFYGLISLLWAIIPNQSVKEVLYLILNFFGFFLLIAFANKALNPQKSILKGWFYLFLLTLPIAIYELIFDYHLPISFQEEGMIMNFGNTIVDRKFASVTYGNLNGYNTILMYMFPFIGGLLFQLKKKSHVILMWIVVFCFSYIVVSNGSRGAVICLIIGFSIFSVFYFKGKKSIFFIILLFAILLIVLKNPDSIFGLILGRFNEQGISDEGRLSLLTSSYDAFIESGMLGIGAGNFMPTMDSVYQLELTASHNLFLEIGIQYGFLVLLLFVGLFVKLIHKQKLNENKWAKLIVVTAIMMFPITSTIDSSYILSVNVWLFLASLFVTSDNYYNVI